MTDDDLSAALSAKQALVVHFSHHANMRPGGIFPADLQDAIVNKDTWHLSCCVVWPHHNMMLPGDVGVIFKPSVKSVLSVSSGDAGSMTTTTGNDLSLGASLSEDSFEQTFNVSGSYNEWRVVGAAVSGIFVRDRLCIHAKKSVILPFPLDCKSEIALEPISFDEVLDAFSRLDIYTFEKGHIQKL